MLQGKTGIFTGATRGLGLAIAERLAESSCHIVLIGFGGATAIEATRAEIAQRIGVRVSHSAADISQPAHRYKPWCAIWLACTTTKPSAT